MDIEEAKKFARNKIEADALVRQVRDVIKTKQNGKNKICGKVLKRHLNHLLNLKIALKKYRRTTKRNYSTT